MTARRGLAAALATGWLLLAAGCATAPPRTASAPRSVPRSDAPVAVPSPAPGTGVPASATVQAWIIAEQWEGFAQAALWPQEWALRRWHNFRNAGGRLDLNPLVPLPPVPPVRALDQGGDPRIWRLEWTAGADLETDTGASAFREVTFGPDEAGGLSPAVHAVRKALASWKPASGRIRVAEVGFDQGRLRYRLELR